MKNRTREEEEEGNAPTEDNIANQQTSDDQAKNPIHIEEESECEDLHQSQEHTVPCGNRKRKVHTGQSLVKPKILVGQFEIHVEKDVKENISKEHPLLNSLCLENERTPSISKRPCNIETNATTTSGLFQKHDEQEKACFESEMSKGQPASAAPTSAVCAGPDSEQTLQNTDIRGGATDQEILVSERLQLTREMKRLASTMRTDHERDLKPSHISAATSDDLSMPLVPCRSTPRMKVKASKREVSQKNAKSNIAVENQADHDGVSQSVQNQQERSLQRKVVVDKKKGKEKRPCSISDQKNTKGKKSTKRIRCLEPSPKNDKVVKRSYLTVPSGVIVALAAQQDKKEKGKSASLGKPLKSKQP
ncbi:hypothetical protein ACFE04_008120 [Oxalis oulophora]